MVASRDGDVVKVYPATNAEASPFRFVIDAREQLEIHSEIEAAELDLGAIYHSHTRTEPKPSQTDINFSKAWPGVLWIIVGLAGGRARCPHLADRRREGERGRAGRGVMADARALRSRSNVRAAARRYPAR